MIDFNGSRRSWIYRGLSASFAGAHAGLLLLGIFHNFVAVDEVGHVPSGLSHWSGRGFAAYRVNPPLPRMIAVLPVLAARPKTDFRGLDVRPGSRPEWTLGLDFRAANPSRYLDLMRLARLSGVIWSLLGCWLVRRWACELYGEAAGCFATALWCFDPTILAFAQLTTPDVPAAVAGLAATYAFWRFVRRPSWSAAVFVGLLLGIAELTKFTLLVFAVVWPLVWWIDRPAIRLSAARIGQALTILLVGLATINAGYGFQGTAARLDRFVFHSRLFAGEISPTRPAQGGNRFRGTPIGLLPVPVPKDYLQGIDTQRGDFEIGLPSYLAGEWKKGGWWDYYLYALAVKLPLGTWALVLWNLGLTIATTGRSRRGDEAFSLIPAASILIFVSSQTGFSHHMRYILPAFPFVIVSTSKLGAFFEPSESRGARRGPFAVLATVALSWSIVSSTAIAPHWMSYFNEWAGGPERGHDHLLDSNIDWGQDLLDLKAWLDRHPEARPLGLAFFHLLDPISFGIDYDPPPPGPPNPLPADNPWELERYGPRPGYYAISVNYLRGAEFPAPNGRGGKTAISRHDYFAYFRRFRPIARAGYSIYIYHIETAEAEAERRVLGLPPLAGGRESSTSSPSSPKTPTARGTIPTRSPKPRREPDRREKSPDSRRERGRLGFFRTEKDDKTCRNQNARCMIPLQSEGREGRADSVERAENRAGPVRNPLATADRDGIVGFFNGRGRFGRRRSSIGGASVL